MREILRGHRPLEVFGDTLLTFHLGCIFAVDLTSGKQKCMLHLPEKRADWFFERSRLYERLTRREIRAAVKLDDRCLIYVYNKRIYCLNVSTGENREEVCLRPRTSAPYYFCRIRGIKGFSDGVVFGDYAANHDRSEPIRIYRRPLTAERWDCIYEFSAGSVRHIHGIVSDPEHGCVYILTGDRDGESGIWITKNDFQTVEPYLVGNQQNRAVHLFLCGERLVYATDTPNETNYIYSLAEKNGIVSAEIIQKINGSCIYASESSNAIFFSSTVEPDERVRGWRSWFNYMLGPGILSRDVYLYRVRKNDLHVDVIASFKKDCFPYKLFQYGQCAMIYDEKRKQLLVYPIAVKKYDGSLLIFDEEGINIV
jgi:hypothetical protein